MCLAFRGQDVVRVEKYKTVREKKNARIEFVVTAVSDVLEFEPDRN